MPNRNQNSRRGRNNNPEGHNQYSNGWIDTARERPITAAAAAAAAVGAGVFLWSRRSQISEQLSNISDQIGEWNESRFSGTNELETVGGGSEFSASSGTGNRSSTASFTGSGSTGSPGMSETGGGNASRGDQSGGSGISGKTGRSRT